MGSLSPPYVLAARTIDSINRNTTLALAATAVCGTAILHGMCGRCLGTDSPGS